jgi:P27 family predicted phage terminase small subunit
VSRKKSTQFHQLAGTFRADRHAKGSLQFPAASGTAPRWLSKVAKAEWRRVAPLLMDQGLLLETDTAILAAYCIAFAGYLECVRQIQEQGQTIIVESQTRTGRTSKPVKNPAVALMFEYQRAMLAAAAKLGFSPYDRERIEGSDSLDDPEDPLQPTYRPVDGPRRPVGVHGDALGAFIKLPQPNSLGNEKASDV